MAFDDTVKVGVTAETEQLTRSLTAAFDQLGTRLDKILSSTLRKIAKNFGDALNSGDALRQNQRLIRSFQSLESTINSINRSTDGFVNSIENLDPGAVAGLSNQLSKIAALQDKLDLGPEVLGVEGYKQVSLELRAVSAGLVAVRETALAAGRAQDEANRNIARDQRQVSREFIQNSKAETSRFVVDQQTQAAAARDATRKRIAFIQAAARTIATIERGLSNIFRQTARVFSSAFRSAATAVTGVAAGIGRAFTRTTTNIRNSVTNSNSEISRSYRKTFGDTTRTVQNETRQQTSVINNFAREARSSIGSIGSGVGLGLGAAIGGILGVGAAKAISGGFERATILENSERALTKLLGTAERAKTLLGEVTDVVTGTPFRLDQFAAGATQLLAFNVEAEKIPEVLRTIGDAAALSIDPDLTVDRLIRTFGQIQAAGKLATEDINQLTEAGVPAWALLGNQLGKTTAEMRELVTDGAVPAEQAIDLLLNGIQNGTSGVNDATVAFAGLSKELGTTLKGSVANFFTAINRLGANVFLALKEPIADFLAAATAGVDFLSKAIQTLAVTIGNSFAVRVLTKGLEALTRGLNNAKTAFQPLFQVIADGVVILGQFALALGAIRRLPGFLRLVGIAATRVFTPFNLLIGAGVLLVGAFKRVLDASPDLRTAFENLGPPLQRIFTVLSDLGEDVLKAFAKVIDEVVTPAVDFFADKVAEFLVPALESLATFLEEKVLPQVRRFARFIRTDVIPFIGTAFAKGVEIGKAALEGITNFIKGTVIPIFGEFVRFVQVAFDVIVRGGTVGGLQAGGSGWLAYNGPVTQGLFRIRRVLEEVAEFFRASVTILWKGDEYTDGIGWLSEDGLVIRGLNNIRSAMESVVSFTKNNFLPVLAGVGTAAGVFALSGSIPIAGLAGITAGIVAALSNDDIRNALVDTVTKAVTAARNALENFIDSGTLGKIAANVLKVANKVGEILGDIISDRRLVAVVGAIAGFAVALAGSFLLGFAEGIAKNLPELVDLLTDTLRKGATEAVKAVVSDPALGLLLVGLFTGAFFIRKLSQAAKASGAIVADGMRNGATKNLGATGGNTTNQFFKGVFGGPAAIRASAAKSGELYAQTFSRRINANRELAQSLTGRSIAGLSQGRDPVTGQLQGIESSTRNLRISETAVRNLTAEYGKGAVAAQTFRLGVRNLGQGLRNLRTDASQARLGVSQLRTTFQLVGREIGITAGIAAGAAFVGAFGAQAAFETGADTTAVVSGVGSSIVAGLGASLVAGGPLTPTGAGVGLAVAGVSLLGGAFLGAKANAEAFKDSVDDLVAALRELDDVEFGETLEDVVRKRLREAPTGARELFIDLKFNTADFTDSLEAGAGVDYIAEQFDRLGPAGAEFGQALRDGEITLGRIDDAIRGTKPFAAIDFEAVQQEIRDAGFETEDFAAAFGYAGETIKFVQASLEELDLQRREEGVQSFGEAFLGASNNVQTLDGNIALYSANLAIAGAASDAFKTKLAELNQARLDSARQNLDEVKQRLNDARDAAGEARDALVDYLNGDYSPEGLQAVTDQAVIDVGNAARAQAQAAEEGLTPEEVAARARQRQAEFAGQGADVLSSAQLELGRPLTQEEAEAALAPLIAAGSAAGGLAGVEAATALQGSLDRYFDETGIDLTQILSSKERTVTGVESSVGRAEKFLADALKIDPTTLQPLVDEAATFAQGVAENVAAGYVQSINEDVTAGAATEAWAQAAIAAATGPLAFDTGSPSKAFEKIGGFVVDGFVLGITNGIEAITTVGADMKAALVAGLDPEGSGEFLTFLDAGRDAGYAFGDGSAIEEVTASLKDRGRGLQEAVMSGIDPEGQGEYLAFLDAGRDSGYAFGDGTANIGVVSSLKDRGRQLALAVKAGIDPEGQGEYLTFLDAGRNAGNAFAAGLRSSLEIVRAAARSVAAAAAAAVESELEIDSPSKVFEGLGRFTMEGFAEGINDSAGLVADAAGSAVKGAVDASIAQAGGVTIGVDAGVTSAAFSLANQQASISATGGGSSMMSISSGDISNLARAIATESKPNVEISQTFTEPVDSRAIASDVAWRLT